MQPMWQWFCWDTQFEQTSEKPTQEKNTNKCSPCRWRSLQDHPVCCCFECLLSDTWLGWSPACYRKRKVQGMLQSIFIKIHIRICNCICIVLYLTQIQIALNLAISPEQNNGKAAQVLVSRLKDTPLHWKTPERFFVSNYNQSECCFCFMTDYKCCH